MVYLVVKNNNDTVVYSFETRSVRDRIYSKVKGSKKYNTESDVVEATGVSKKDFVDGIEAINLYDRIFLEVKGTPFDGVYFFKTDKKAMDIADSFEDTSIYFDINEMLSKTGISVSDVKDGGFLMRESVQSWCRKNQINSRNIEKVDVSRVAANSENIENSAKVELEQTEVDKVKSLFKILSEKGDVFKITMSNGDVVKIAYRPVFYRAKHVDLTNTAFISNGDKAVLREDAINTMIENKDIIIINRSHLQYCGDFLIVMQADDEYSPDIKEVDGKVSFNHSIESICLNVNQIASIQPMNGYSDIHFSRITKESNSLLYKYLIKKVSG